jgi:hypothetical protein
MKQKKAAIEVQFNWVFVMVAGALILVFFFGIVQKQREMSQAKISNSLLTNIESIATGAGVSRGTVQRVGLPNIGINFDCTEECLCSYSIEDIRKEYHDKIIFAPKLVKGSEIILWTLDWKIPFRVTNVVYATTANDKYFFVYDNKDSPMLKMFQDAVPPEINAEYVHISQYPALTYENYNSAKFIFVDTASPPPNNLGIHKSFRRAPVSGLYVTSGGDAFFYDKTSNRELNFRQKPSSYFGEQLLFGAVFASGSNTYDCNVISAMSRLKNIITLFIQRTQSLDEQNNNKNFCIKGYSTAALEDMWNAADTASKTPAYIKSMASPIAAVNTQNEDLLRSACPLLY